MTTPKAPRVQAAIRTWDTPAPIRSVDRKVSDPPEPIILMHGMAGWKKIAGVDYFNGVDGFYRFKAGSGFSFRGLLAGCSEVLIVVDGHVVVDLLDGVIPSSAHRRPG